MRAPIHRAPLDYCRPSMVGAATTALAKAAIDRDLPRTTGAWLARVAPVFRILEIKAANPSVSDDELIRAAERLAIGAAALFPHFDNRAYEEGLLRALGPAVLNGAFDRAAAFEKGK